MPESFLFHVYETLSGTLLFIKPSLSQMSDYFYGASPMIRRILFSILVLMIVLAACNQSPQVPNPTVQVEPLPSSTNAAPTPTVPTPADTVPSPTETLPPVILPERFVDAHQGVVQKYNLQPEQVRLVSQTYVDWPDSCLGVQRSGIQCMMVITPGYQLIFDTPYGPVEVHTNQDGTVVLILAPTSGIRGNVLVGPACPGPVTPGKDCPDQPFEGYLVITEANGSIVAEVYTDPDGRFEVNLPPGRYTISPPPGKPFPSGSPLEVDVKPNQFTPIKMLLDSGIR